MGGEGVAKNSLPAIWLPEASHRQDTGASLQARLVMSGFVASKAKHVWTAQFVKVVYLNCELFKARLWCLQEGVR